MALPTKQDRKLDRILDELEDLTDYFLNMVFHPVAYQANDPKATAALRTIKEMMHRIDDCFKWGDVHLIKWKEVKRWIKTLDHIFFGGKIKHYAILCRFEWILDGDPRGDFCMGAMQVAGEMTLLALNPYCHNDSIGLIGTLLHEMVQICIHLTAQQHCLLVKTEKNKEAVAVFKELYGVTGHGCYFQKLAHAVEDRARIIFENKRIDLGRIESLIHEGETGGMLPSLEYCNLFYGNVVPYWVLPRLREFEESEEDQEKHGESEVAAGSVWDGSQLIGKLGSWPVEYGDGYWSIPKFR